MMRRSLCFALPLAVLVLDALPASAQPDVIRQRMTYLGSYLTIDVQADVPGQLRLTRGEFGRIDVAARASGGFPAIGLAQSAGDRLSLTALGGESAEYLVVVPPDVYVRVLLPDRPVAETFGSLRRSATYAWDVEPVPEDPALAATGGGPDVPAVPVALPFRYQAGTAPSRVIIAGAAPVAVLTVRWEGSQFQVAADEPLSVLESPPTLELRPDAGVSQLVITIPWLVEDFVLESARGTLLRITDGSVSYVCAPVTQQTLSGERRWFTFSAASAVDPCVTAQTGGAPGP